MSSPIKSLQKSRLYNVLANRSLYTHHGNNVANFFDTPSPPPPPRPSNSHLLTTTRIQFDKAPDSPTHNTNPNSQPSAPPKALALSVPSNSQLNTLPLSAVAPVPPILSHLQSSLPPQLPTALLENAVPGPSRCTLDVGAYGIPKRRGIPSEEPNGSDTTLSVQVGEDAYFMRGNAMGVADGVGGWARRVPNPISGPSPSALFARRLMHFCASEISNAQSHIPHLIHTAEASPYSERFWPLPDDRVQLRSSYDFDRTKPGFIKDDVESDLDDVSELQDSLDELEDGLDVLMILERAYEQTLRAHIVPAPSKSQLTNPPYSDSPTLPPSSGPAQPLLCGSSTALLAVLEQPNSLPTSSPPLSTPIVHSRHGLEFHPSSHLQIDPHSSSSPRDELNGNPGGAVIKIAHVGDCAGILVRGESIVWRSEEMWSGFNTPAQLGPLSGFPPTRAQTVTLPVCMDDVLILASDGLSDNLWDCDILAEVVRLRNAFLGSGIIPNIPTFGSLLRRRTLAGILSEALCAQAWRIAETRVGQTPFSNRAREFGHLFQGGKRDDISVVVAVVSPVLD